jgi:integrase/recombinase XerD
MRQLHISARCEFIIILKAEVNMPKSAVETNETVLPVEAEDQLKTLVDDFLRDLDAARKSPHTIKNYRSDLGRFRKFVATEQRSLDIPLIRTYLATLQDLAPATRARHHSALKSFFEWCYRHDLIAVNPMGKFDAPKVSQGLPRPIPKKSQERLMRVIRAAKPRERLLFTLVAETGLRIDEALGIYVEDVRLDAGQEGIRFRGKGDFEREVPLPFEFECLKLLRGYIRNEDLVAGPLFRTGKDCDRRMTYGTALYQWQKLCKEAGVECEIHQLRHTVATTLLNRGVGIGTVRRLLGHKNLQTTQRYAELADETVRQELEAFARRRGRTT